ncbi:protein artemis-like isoform X2 [Schistocerca piceifrons]|uniref:protein artemis-like isoform X2 n=1 Tax=Schistocerca piceifrons TaxID=274613 RepID=UPI001F5F035A|nr:protein artemis-like isoform X2 [Schistocerca piceifrons]
MSTFGGRMQEIPDVSVDNFENENLLSTAFFLSHAHTDHMRGLNDVAFYERLLTAEKEGCTVYLYCSDITRVYLMDMKFKKGKKHLTNMGFEKIDKYIKVLPLGPSLIDVPSPENSDSRTLAVTCIPAGHCPGSVMFLFETDKFNVLYTGDFRILPEDICKFTSLRNGPSLKKIHTLYLDTTFLDRCYYYFPSRAESASTVCNRICEWLQLSPRHTVVIDLPARCGTEFIFVKIKETLGIKVHVNNETYLQYKGIEEIHTCLTDDSRYARVHACCLRNEVQNLSLPSWPGDDYHTRIIKPSAMWFESSGKDGKPLSVTSRGGYHCQVAHSSHASFKELADFIYTLKPNHIVPTAVPSWKSIREVQKILKELLSNPHST